MAKIKTVGTIGDFIRSEARGSRAEKDYKTAGVALGIVGVSGVCVILGDASIASANMVDGFVAEKVVRSFDPLVELVRALSYPIGLVMMLGGGLFVMIGNSDRGFGMIQKAGLGYILIQMLPIMMDLLVEIASAM